MQLSLREAAQSWRATPQQTYQHLVAKLNREVAEGRYRFPPVFAIDVLGLCRNVQANAERIHKQVASDPELLARVQWLAGSSLYGDCGPFRTVVEMAQRLGPSLTREIVGHSVVTLYACGGPHYPTWRGQICSQSAGVGFACAALAREMDRGTDWAFAAGVLHDVGKAVMIQIMSAMPEGLAAPGEMARRLLETEHTRVARAVAMRQHLCGPLVCALSRHHDYDPRSDDDEPAAMVGLARRIWKATTGQAFGEDSNWPEVSGLGLTDYQVSRVIDQVTSLKPRLLALGGYLEEANPEATALAS